MTQKLVGFLAMMSLVGCNLGSDSTGLETETATESVTQALDGTSNTSDSAEVANLFRGPKNFRLSAAEGFRCDSSPDITYVDVCGQQLPSAVHLEWTDCAAPSRPGHRDADGGMGGPPPGGPQGHPGGGKFPPPPPPPHGGKGGKGHGPRFEDGGTPVPPPPPNADGGFTALGRLAHGPSSGIIDITYTYADNGCTGNIEQTQSVTFDISRTAPDGAVSHTEGTANSVADLVSNGRPEVKSSSVDVTYTVTDASGNVVRSIDIVGSRTVAFSSDEPPTRTINSSYTETYSDGTTGSVTEVDVVRPPMDVCPWPTSGTLTRTKQDGTTHTIVYGPTCGEATLDGVAIDLSERRVEKLKAAVRAKWEGRR